MEPICKLKKCNYSLKQSPHRWNEKLCERLKPSGFKEGGADSCACIQRGMKIIAMYVDNLILMVKSLDEVQQMKESLSETFKMKDMGQLRYCLGINFEITEQGVSLCQKQYLRKLLDSLKPILLLPQCQANKGRWLQQKYQYQSMVGSLLHAAKATRSDIAYAVGKVFV